MKSIAVVLGTTRWARLVIVAIAACGTMAVNAQTAGNAALAADDAGLQEVVVTATRRSETVINTPASVSAVTAADLGAGRIQNVADLAEAVPNLSVGNQFGVNRAFIRGIGLTSIDLGGDGA